MANQSPDRRQVVTMLAKVAAIGQFPGFSRWISAAEHHHDDPVQPRPAQYLPQFFTPQEYKLVDQVTELILPKDEAPGARDVGVAEFIDFMAAHEFTDVQFKFRTGVAWLDAFAFSNYGAGFCSLDEARQTELLSRLALQAKRKPEESEGQKFFELMREYTVMGYYTSRAGLEALDDPGLKLYSSSPACPHKDDPEHRHLSSARS